MKKIIFLILLVAILIIIVFLWYQQKTDDIPVDINSNLIDNSNWSVYVSDEFGFQIKLPPKWSDVKINHKYDDWYQGEKFEFKLKDVSEEYRDVCIIVVQSYENWSAYKKEEVINKISYITDYNGNVYSYSCSHEDIGYVNFPEYNKAFEELVEKSRLEGNYNYVYDRAGGPFDQFFNLIIPSFEILH